MQTCGLNKYACECACMQACVDMWMQGCSPSPPSLEGMNVCIFALGRMGNENKVQASFPSGMPFRLAAAVQRQPLLPDVPQGDFVLN